MSLVKFGYFFESKVVITFSLKVSFDPHDVSMDEEAFPSADA